MRLYDCPACGARLFFRNLACVCGAAVTYDPEADAFADDEAPCANRESIDCNWCADGPGTLCRSCAMTAVIPDAFHGDNRALWAEVEREKRWALAGLGRWGWFRAADPGPRPVFHLLAEQTAAGPADVTMGHADGVVTLNVAEADPAERTRRREDLGEPYRTLIGHVRHELSHMLFERLAAEEPGFADRFRERFGDERADYGAALAAYYAAGAPADWPTRHVSAYAASHPHEDWAESAAHAVALTDIVDSAAAAGLLSTEAGPLPQDAYAERHPETLIAAGAALGIALNHVNRSMGQPDLYPFVLADTARAKLAFAHEALAAGPRPAG